VVQAAAVAVAKVVAVLDREALETRTDRVDPVVLVVAVAVLRQMVAWVVMDALVATALAAVVAAGDTVVETLVVTLVAIVMALLVAGADLTTLVVQHSIVLQKQETTVQWHKVVTHSVTVLVTEMVAWVELLLGTEYD
jgi:hypothetical protein